MRSIIFLVLTSFTLAANAGDFINDADKLRAIFTDKTAFGKHLKKTDKPAYDIYFAPDGSLSRVLKNGGKQTGKWRISDDAKHCVKWDHADAEKCMPVRQGNDEGIYFRVKIINENRQPKVTIYKDFRDGNQLPK